jgi:hypothetical protein
MVRQVQKNLDRLGKPAPVESPLRLVGRTNLFTSFVPASGHLTPSRAVTYRNGSGRLFRTGSLAWMRAWDSLARQNGERVEVEQVHQPALLPGPRAAPAAMLLMSFTLSVGAMVKGHS